MARSASRIRRVLLGSAVLIGTAGFVHSQDAPNSGRVIRLDVETGLRVVDNYQLTTPATDTTILFENKLTFGVDFENDVSKLVLRTGGNLQFTDVDGAGSDFDLDNEFANLAYERTGSTGHFKASVNYSQSNLRDAVQDLVLQEALSGTDLVFDNGTRKRQGYDLSYEWNNVGPIGLRLATGEQRTSYADTTDADLVETDSRRYSATALLGLRQNLDGELEFSRSEYSQENATRTERTTDTIELRLDYDVTPIWTVDASIGYRTIETEERTTNAITEESGTIGSLGIARELPTGNLRLGVATSEASTGRRSDVQLSFDGERDLKQYGFSIGAVRNPNGDNDLFGSVNYAYQLPTSSVSVGLSQSYTTDSDGDDIESTRANLSYQYQISDISSLGFSLSHSEVSDGAGSDSEVQTASATYSRSVTEDWRLRTGLKYTRQDDSTDVAKSNEIFLNLSRSFEF